MTRLVQWEEVPSEVESPVYGPPCGVKPEGHTWRLTIEPYTGHGIGIGLTSGCQECDDAVLAECGEETYLAGELHGRLVWEPECDNLGGWHGLDTRCDHGWFWRFEPQRIVSEEEL